MPLHFLGPDSLDEQIEAALNRVVEGELPEVVESAQVDFKEESGRRAPDGSVRTGEARNEAAAAALTHAMASMANSAGGGAVVLGVADDGTLVGTQIDPDWLRARIWELSGNRLTVNVRAAEFNGCRLLLLSTPEVVEPISYQGKLHHRVGPRSVQMDISAWHSARLHRSGADWSAQPSGHAIEDASAAALDTARRHLASEGAATDLAKANDAELLRRLSLADSDGRLSNAGSLLFVGTPEPGIDYIRRDGSGGDSRYRLRGTEPLVMQVQQVELAAEAANPVHHIELGFVHRQVQSVPSRALREAIVNGVAHRDWLSPLPTVVEHVAETVTVTSPGGFVGGIDPSNIITHPAVPRHRALAEALAMLKYAERQGVGVARMVRDMLALGRPAPEISELVGPFVRVVLMGGSPDVALASLLSSIEPPDVASSVDTALVIDHLCRIGWADRYTAALTLQRGEAETADILERLAEATFVVGGTPRANDGIQEPGVVPPAGDVRRRSPAAVPIIVRIAGSPDSRHAACMISVPARKHLHRRNAVHAPIEGQLRVAFSYATARGRISSTEAASLLSVSTPTAVARLRALAEAGELVSSNANVGGRGHHYVPADLI